MNALPWQPAAPLAPSLQTDLRRRAMFEWDKWDQQIGDVATFSGFPVILTPAAWRELASLAESLAAETLAAERELCTRPDLHSTLALPCRLRAALRRAAHQPPVHGPRLIRFDFHYTTEGWRISEANTDVPGGLNETAGYPKLLAPHYPGTTPSPDVCTAYLDAMAAHVPPGGRIAFVHATAYTDDHQAMRHLADRATSRGWDAQLLAPDRLRWSNGRADADLVVRFFPAEWLPNLPASCPWQHYVAGAATPLSNPATAILTQSKRLPLVWDRLRTPLPTWRRLLPTTTAPHRAPWRTDRAWLVKPALGRVGEDIGLRDALAPRDWRRIARGARWFPNHWIAQRTFASLPMQCGSDAWHLCIGVFTVDGRCAGAYGRAAPRPLIDQFARDVAVLIAADESTPRKDASP